MAAILGIATCRPPAVFLSSKSNVARGIPISKPVVDPVRQYPRVARVSARATTALGVDSCPDKINTISGRFVVHSKTLRLKVAFSGDGPTEDTVLVVGATGGVGQLVVASLLEKGIAVRALVRDKAKAGSLFSGAPAGKLEIVTADLRYPGQITPELTEGVSSVLLCTGTTAFPSKRWQGGNGPEQTDYVSVRNFVNACSKSVKRLVLVSSVGVTRYDKLPYSILNLFGVLKYKKMAEELIQASGLPYTIIRPGRLTDGPYTSYDLNTLLKATSGARKAVVIKRGDSIAGETSRTAVAEAAVQALFTDEAKNDVFEILSVEGPWPGEATAAWSTLFREAPVSP